MNNFKHQQQEFLPISVNVTGKKLLIVGAGKAALSKVRSLRRFNVSITVIGIKIDPAFLEIDNIHIIHKSYDPSDLDDFFMVYACTDNRHTNEIIREHCHARNILVNLADNPRLSDFISPAVYQEEDLTIAVGSNGKNVKQSIMIRENIKKNSGPDLTGYLSLEKTSLNGEKNRDRSQKPFVPKVILAGFGPGDPELMTLKTHRYLLAADIIFHDALVDSRFLEHYPARKIAVGKRCGQHHIQQVEINQLLVSAALSGKKVVRLKGGDPLIFGRAGEELQFLAENNIDVKIVPGITSAFAAAAQYGIPLTHREIGSSVAFCVGHNIAERELPQASTLVFYMGARQQCEISNILIKKGWNKNTPVALISNVSNPQSKVVISQLDQLCQHPLLQETPLLIIVGQVVKKMPEFEEIAPRTEKKKKHIFAV
ncbi:uroporphyrinogen-III C-methyltransferase [Thermophagus sp. OGC60D27]|uniref:uroporphyrinogen-III C-methyltransferase n=1 Tax=Thermophagus sp. OGC60D27 TaxID=3458415 RepID=UPI0040383CAB